MAETLLLTVPQTARKLGRHRSYVYKLISDGLLEAVDAALPGAKQTALRVPAAALDRYVDNLPRVLEPAP